MRLYLVAHSEPGGRLRRKQLRPRVPSTFVALSISRCSHLAHIALDAEPSAHFDAREHPEAAGEVGAAAVDDAARVFLARHLARVRERRYFAPARIENFKP